jgi:hypothetical protein
MTATAMITMRRPVTSTIVMTTLLFSDSLMPLALDAATKIRKTMAAGMAGTSTKVPR